MCQIVREMSRCLQYEQDPLWNKKKEILSFRNIEKSEYSAGSDPYLIWK